MAKQQSKHAAAKPQHKGQAGGGRKEVKKQQQCSKASSSPGVRKDATKLKSHGSAKKPAAQPLSTRQAERGARAVTQGLGLNAANLSALLDQAVTDLQDRNIKCGRKAGGISGGDAASAAPVSLAAAATPHFNVPSAPPPTPAGPMTAPRHHALAGLAAPRAPEQHDPAAVLESLSGWGL